jgi:hypothetical protein
VVEDGLFLFVYRSSRIAHAKLGRVATMNLDYQEVVP